MSGQDLERRARALEWVRELAKVDAQGAREHLPTIEEAIAAYDPNCGARTVRVDDAMGELIEAAKKATELAMHDGASSQEACERLVAALARAQGVQS